MLKKTIILLATTAILLPMQAVEASDRDRKASSKRSKPNVSREVSKPKVSKPRASAPRASKPRASGNRAAPSRAAPARASKPKYTAPDRSRTDARSAPPSKPRYSAPSRARSGEDLRRRSSGKPTRSLSQSRQNEQVSRSPVSRQNVRREAENRSYSSRTVKRRAADRASSDARATAADRQLRQIQRDRREARTAYNQRRAVRREPVRAQNNPAADVRRRATVDRRRAADRDVKRDRFVARPNPNRAAVASTPSARAHATGRRDTYRATSRGGYARDNWRPNRHGNNYRPRGRDDHRYDRDGHRGRNNHNYYNRYGSHRRWHQGRRHSDWNFYLGFGNYWGGWGLGYSAGYRSGWYDRYRYGYWYGPQYDFFGHWPLTAGYLHHRSHWLWHHHHHHYHYGDYCPNRYHGNYVSYGYYDNANDSDTVAGVLLGGIVGGIIGAEIDGGHNRTTGTILGAAIGAAVGGAAASDDDHDHSSNTYYADDVWDSDGRHRFETEPYRPPEEIRTCMRYEDVNGNYVCTKWTVEYFYDD